MAEGLNRIMLIGNLGTDPELAYTPSNQPVLKFRMATSESYQTRTGERQQRTEWHNVVIWGKRGEALHKILGKGSHICVEGSIRSRDWEGRDGVKRHSIDIIALNVVLLGGRGGAGGAGGGGGGGARTGAPDTSSPLPPDEEGEAIGGGGGGSGGGSGGGDFGGGAPGADDDIPF